MTQRSDRYDDAGTRLMVEFAAGGDAAFEEIMETFQNRVFGIIRRYLGGAIDAEDCAQEVFLRLYRMRRSYRPTAKLSTLIYRITTNLCLNKLRDDARRRTLSLESSGEDGVAGLAAALPDSTIPSAQEVLEKRERAEIVRKALSRIPDRQRMALVLHRFEGLSYKEIADAMETNVDAVKSLLSRARGSLADALQGEMEAGNL